MVLSFAFRPPHLEGWARRLTPYLRDSVILASDSPRYHIPIMEQITRAEALKRGLNRYFTGKPCPKGHIGERNVLRFGCIACERQRAAAWAAGNAERYRENQQRYRDDHRQETAEYNRRYKKENKERLRLKRKAVSEADANLHARTHQKRYADPDYARKCKERTKRWKAANRKRAVANEAAWRTANPTRAKAIQQAGWINRRTRERKVGKLKASDVAAVKASGICTACGIAAGPMEIDHKVALSRGGTNHRSNLQLLCRPCNRSKWAKDLTDWLAERD